MKLTNETVPSLSDLMEKAFYLSLQVGYSEIAPDNSYLTARQEQIGTEDEESMVWAWADGLYHKMYENVSTGHCSPQQTIDFDITKFEESVIRNIATMERLLKELGEPKKLDFAEMQRRGYKGKWAGL